MSPQPSTRPIEPVIHLRGVKKVFLTEDIETHALGGINLRIDPGEFVAIVGPSGSGKTTLLAILGLMDRPTSGEYKLRGAPIDALGDAALARARNEAVGFIFQTFNLIGDLTVEQNIGLPLVYRRVPLKERRERVAQALERVGMSHRARHMPGQLSGGQQQRVAVARALVGEPSILLADEPTGNLDSANGATIMDLIDGLHRAGSTICMVTHDAAFARRAQRTVRLSDGRMVEALVSRPLSRDGTKESRLRVWLAAVLDAAISLVSTPRYSVPAILSLALGIGASTAAFAVFSAVELRPLPFPREGELVEVVLKGASDDDSGLSATYTAKLAELHAIFASFAAYHESELTVTGLGEARRATTGVVTPGFFDTLEAQAEVGRTFTARGGAPDGTDVAVIGHSFWLSAFGGAPVLGKTVMVDGVPKTILGVLPDAAALPAQRDMWIPIVFTEREKSQRFDCFLDSVGRLAPGVSLDVAAQRLRAETERQNIHSSSGDLVYAAMVPLRDRLVGNARTSVALMTAAVAAFLLLACANVASLLVTRASVRARALAIRAALGASPLDLARETCVEALVLTVVGSLAGLALAVGLIDLTNHARLGSLAYAHVQIDGRVLAAFVALALLAAVVAGAAPAVHALHVRPMDSLRADGRTSSSLATRRLREILVAIQVAATVVLLVNAVVLARSVQSLHAVDPGFDARSVAGRVLYPPLRRTPEMMTAFANDVLARAEHLPGVTAAAVARDVPFDGNESTVSVEMDPSAPRKDVYSAVHIVSPAYFRAMGMGLLAGRTFTDSECALDAPVLVVSRAFADRLVGTPNALGRKVSLGFTTEDGAKIWHEIVGVVEDTHDIALTRPIEPAMYMPFSTGTRIGGSGIAVVVRAEGDPDRVFAALPRVIREVNPDAPIYAESSLGAMVERSYGGQTALERLLGAFAVASVLLAGIGLFGVTSYTVAERAAEIGIRRALGASRGAIVEMILRETGMVVAIGMAGGIACTFAARTLLATFLYGVTASDLGTYLAVCAGVTGVALLAALAPAKSAASVAPSRALEVR